MLGILSAKVYNVGIETYVGQKWRELFYKIQMKGKILWLDM